MIEAAFFWILALASIIGGLLVVLHRNPVTCAISLAGLSLALAALFLMLEAFFLAVAQIIVYTGAVVVLFLFILMLTEIKNASEEKTSRFRLVVSALLGLALIGTFVAIFSRFEKASLVWPPAIAMPPLETLGQFLFTGYALPFLTVAVLLLTAVVGVILLAKKDESTH